MFHYVPLNPAGTAVCSARLAAIVVLFEHALPPQCKVGIEAVSEMRA